MRQNTTVFPENKLRAAGACRWPVPESVALLHLLDAEASVVVLIQVRQERREVVEVNGILAAIRHEPVEVAP